MTTDAESPLNESRSSEDGADNYSPEKAAKSRSRRTEMSFDKATGRYAAKLGRKKTKSGKTDGHKFRFTADLKESERRKLRIQDMWDRLVRNHLESDYYWDDESLGIAQALAEGKSEVRFSVEQLAPREKIQEQPSPYRGRTTLYAKEIVRLQMAYPEVTIAPVPEDAHLAEVGRKKVAHFLKATTAWHQHFLSPNVTAPGPANQRTVAQALDAYEAHTRKTMQIMPDQEEGLEGKRLSDSGRSCLKQIDQVRKHNSEQLDWPLSRLTFQGCDAMLEVWRQRPPKHDGSTLMAIKTCREHAKILKRFFRWLSKSDEFDWKKPEDFDELSLGIRSSNRDRASRVTALSRQVRTFTVEELVVLNQYAIPFERFLLLCGLNLGFKRMECATLRVGEIHLNTLHDHAKYIDFQFSENNSFVRRIRTKSGVYAEWILWPLTTRAMEWLLKKRKQQTQITQGDGKGRTIPFNSEALVLLTDSGHSFTKPTKSNNPNHQITNGWSRLLKRIRDDQDDSDQEKFPWLPHETLRDTSANWIREEFGGEIAELFLSHGSPLGSDSLLEFYTNKPFGRLFKALQWLETKLKPVFDATPPNPFPEERKQRIGGLSVRQLKIIREMLATGTPVPQIAAKAKCSKMSVYRCKNDTMAQTGSVLHNSRQQEDGGTGPVNDAEVEGETEN
jgi:hypothetical protein